jgi:uncharacterized membrane protein
MSEKLEDIIRKSLDTVERRHKKFLWVGIIMTLIAVWFLVTMAMFVDVQPQTLEHLSFQIMLGFDGLGAFIAALCFFVMVTSQRNTRAILKAIDMVSSSKSEQ